MDLTKIQQMLKKQNLDGWLLYDFRRSNDLALQVLKMPNTTFLTRRFFYWIPLEGTPIKIVSAIESHNLDYLPGTLYTYRSWQELHEHLKNTLTNAKTIAMEYSPFNAIPYLSKVDGGTLELVQKYTESIVSSQHLLQQFTSVITQNQAKSHYDAANMLDATVEKAFAFIADHLTQQKQITEYDVQQFILNEFKQNGYISEGDPICAVNEHSSDPHYSPSATNPTIIQKEDIILIDLWCKKKEKDSVYADITRMGFAGKTPTEEHQKIFNIVKKSRDAATNFIKERYKVNNPPAGWEVDALARQIIQQEGYGEYFTHRTGHNIYTEDHGPGTHLDNLETHDERLLIPSTIFSIEPGIYLPGKFGVRLEYNIYIDQDKNIHVTGGTQDQITCLF